jgi:O-antigen/teichoic acid export membrane protein
VTVARVDLRRFMQQPALLGAAVRRNLMQISFIAFPICTGGAAIIPLLFDTWLGARWHGAIVPAQIMLLQGIPFTTIYVSAAVLLALNQPRWEALICTAQSLATVIMVACVGRYGPSAAAVAILACAIGTVPLAIAGMRRAGVTLADITAPQLPVLAAAAFMGLAVLGLGPAATHHWHGAAALALQVAAGAVIFASLVFALVPRTLRAAMAEIVKRFAAPVSVSGHEK